jgi:hypothetical protein
MVDIDKTAKQEAAPAVAGAVQIVPLLQGKGTVRVGASAGWLTPRGIQHWEREVSFVVRSDVTPELARSLRATLPTEQIAPKKYPLASRAVVATPLLAIASNLAADLRRHGVRVHSVGVDRVSSGFYYLADGGAGDPVDAHANLIEMLVPSVGSSASNDEIAALLENALDRLLLALSGGLLGELDVELADALPRLARDGTGLSGVDLDAFELQARTLHDRSAAWEDGARRLASSLGEAERAGRDQAQVPLYGEARRERLPPLDLLVSGRTLRLPAHLRWTVRGVPQPEVAPAGRPRATSTPAAASLDAVTRPAASPAPAASSLAANARAQAAAQPAAANASARTREAVSPSPSPERAVAAVAAPTPAPAPSLAPTAEPAPIDAERPRAAQAAGPDASAPATKQAEVIAAQAILIVPGAPAPTPVEARAPSTPEGTVPGMAALSPVPPAHAPLEPSPQAPPEPELAPPAHDIAPERAPEVAQPPETAPRAAAEATSPAPAAEPASASIRAAASATRSRGTKASPEPSSRAALTQTETRRSSGSMLYVALVVLAAGGYAIWEWLQHHHLGH